MTNTDCLDGALLQFWYYFTSIPTTDRTPDRIPVQLHPRLHPIAQVPMVHWVVVEDALERSSLVASLLKRSGLPHTHLWAKTPEEQQLRPNDPSWLRPKGVLQRNAALRWLRSLAPRSDGVVYFADDDNTYDLRLFEEASGRLWVGAVGRLLDTHMLE